MQHRRIPYGLATCMVAVLGVLPGPPASAERSCRAAGPVCLNAQYPSEVPTREPSDPSSGWTSQAGVVAGGGRRPFSADAPDCVDDDPQAGRLCKAYVAAGYVRAVYGIAGQGGASCGASYVREGHVPCRR